MAKPLWSVAVAAGLALGGTAQTVQAAAVAAEIERYCIRCHNARLQTGGLVLETLDLAEPGAHVDVWEQVVRKLRAGVMPPAGAPRPDSATYGRMIAELEAALDAHAAAAPNPGRTSVHRLNRTEYTNAIRDLLALDIDGETLLPGDNSLEGFDNIAEVLTMSPGLLERYLLAAKKISRLALGDPAIRPETTVYSLPYLTLVQNVRMSEDLPFGSRGGAAVRHHFPVDGEYEIRLFLQRNALNVGYAVRGLDARNLLDLRLDGKRLERFDVRPDVGEIGRGGYPVDSTDEQLRLRVTTTAGEHTLGVAFNRDHWYVEGVGMSVLPPASDGYGAGTQTNVNFGRIDSGLDRIEITGPFNAARPSATAPRERLFTCRPGGPGDEPCAAEILGTVARRAWRRPVAAGELDMLLGFFRAGRDEAGAFDDGIELGLVRVLTDPAFLFRVEHDPAGAAPGAPYRLGGLDLASRLSFFLWSSLPDDALIDAAAAGELDDPAAVDAQVGRMLDDPRSDALIDNFFGQWLLLRNMATAQPDPQAFPEFDENLRAAFDRESRLLLQHPAPRGPAAHRAADRRLHVRQPAPRPPLRHPRRGRQPLPPRVAARRQRPRRVAGARQPADGHVVPRPDVRRVARQVRPGEQSWARRRPRRPPRCRRSKPRRCTARCASAWSSIGPIRSARPATRRSTRWASPWRTSTGSASGARKTAGSRSTRRVRCPTGRRSTGRPPSAARCWAGSRPTGRRWPSACSPMRSAAPCRPPTCRQ